MKYFILTLIKKKNFKNKLNTTIPIFQERKEAILRRNMEREARIEARRNAQRNSQCFAFGSSTPRSFDLDLAAIGVQGSVLMCSVSRRPEEREMGPPRATSACSLDRKFG